MLNRNKKLFQRSAAIPEKQLSIQGIFKKVGPCAVKKPKKVDFLIVLQQAKERKNAMRVVQFTIQVTQQRSAVQMEKLSDRQSTEMSQKHPSDIKDRRKFNSNRQLFGSAYWQKQQQIAYSTKKKNDDQELKAIRALVSQFSHKKQNDEELCAKRKVKFY